MTNRKLKKLLADTMLEKAALVVMIQKQWQALQAGARQRIIW